jgi:hypothetical protein
LIVGVQIIVTVFGQTPRFLREIRLAHSTKTVIPIGSSKLPIDKQIAISPICYGIGEEALTAARFFLACLIKEKIYDFIY